MSIDLLIDDVLLRIFATMCLPDRLVVIGVCRHYRDLLFPVMFDSLCKQMGAKDEGHLFATYGSHRLIHFALYLDYRSGIKAEVFIIRTGTEGLGFFQAEWRQPRVFTLPYPPGLYSDCQHCRRGMARLPRGVCHKCIASLKDRLAERKKHVQEIERLEALLSSVDKSS